jgi:hypothetical protein
MSGLTRFIKHSNVEQVVQRLDEMLVVDKDTGKTPGILLLLGLPKTGKDRVLRYWMEGEHREVQSGEPGDSPRIGFADVWRTRGDTLGRAVYVTPMTCLTFSEIAYGLATISRQYTPAYAAPKWFREPKSLYRDQQFLSLFSFVRQEVQRLRIRALVLNNAQWFDTWTLEMLHLLRRHCGNHLSLILSAQIPLNGTLDEPLAEEFRRVPEAAAECERIELQPLTKKEYRSIILRGLADQLNLAFADELLDKTVAKHVANELWGRTGADWQAIDNLALAIKRAAPEPRNGKPRFITLAIWEQILGKKVRPPVSEDLSF